MLSYRNGKKIKTAFDMKKQAKYSLVEEKGPYTVFLRKYGP